MHVSIYIYKRVIVSYDRSDEDQMDKGYEGMKRVQPCWLFVARSHDFTDFRCKALISSRVLMRAWIVRLRKMQFRLVYQADMLIKKNSACDGIKNRLGNPPER